jgi:hypothetical protein
MHTGSVVKGTKGTEFSHMYRIDVTRDGRSKSTALLGCCAERFHAGFGYCPFAHTSKSRVVHCPQKCARKRISPPGYLHGYLISRRKAIGLRNPYIYGFKMLSFFLVYINISTRNLGGNAQTPDAGWQSPYNGTGYFIRAKPY